MNRILIFNSLGLVVSQIILTKNPVKALVKLALIFEPQLKKDNIKLKTFVEKLINEKEIKINGTKFILIKPTIREEKILNHRLEKKKNQVQDSRTP